MLLYYFLFLLLPDINNCEFEDLCMHQHGKQICYPEDPHYYINCEANGGTKQRCFGDLSFDPVPQACVQISKTMCVKRYPSSNSQLSAAQKLCEEKSKHAAVYKTDDYGTRYFCHEGNSYLVCPLNFITAAIKSCPDGLMFNSKDLRCDWKGDLCNSQPDVPAQNMEMSQHGCIECETQPWRQCICDKIMNYEENKHLQVKNYCDPEYSDQYLQCQRHTNGSVTVVCFECAAGTKFTKAIEVCGSEGDCNDCMECKECDPNTTTTTTTCPTTTTTTIPPTTTTTSTTTTTTTTTTSTTPIPCPLTELQKCYCDEALNNNYGSIEICDPEAPNQYLSCESGRTKTGMTEAITCKACPSSLMFNEESGKCDYIAKCPFRPPACYPTTPPPTTTSTTSTTSTTTTSPSSGCYSKIFLHKHKLCWAEAKRVCEIAAGHLLVIDSKERYEEVLMRFGDCGPVWIGASDSNVEGCWKWVTGKRVTKPTWWHHNEPNDAGSYQNCLQMNYFSPGVWDDDDCRERKNFLCEHIVCDKCGANCEAGYLISDSTLTPNSTEAEPNTSPDKFSTLTKLKNLLSKGGHDTSP